MEYRKLGNTGLKVSELCLGSWLTYGNTADDAVAEACIERALELGINFFDTADVYAAGKAEVVVGRALRKVPHNRYVIATKAYFPTGDRPNDRGLSRKHIREECEASLRRLGLDYVDLFQCHRYDTETPLAETLHALSDLVRTGKALYIGFSQWTPEQIQEALHLQDSLGLARFVSSQPYYNMLGRDAEANVFPLCEGEGVGQIVFSPLAQGVLTGKYKPGQPPPEGTRASDSRQNMFLNRGQLDPRSLEKVQRLQPIAERAGMSMPQLALAWCLRLSAVSSVIIGASRPSQVEENAGASGKPLSSDILAEIDRVLAG